jgi:hypothetical protein
MSKRLHGSLSGICESDILICSRKPRYVHILQCYINVMSKYALVVNMLVMYDLHFADEIFIMREGCNAQEIR